MRVTERIAKTLINDEKLSKMLAKTGWNTTAVYQSWSERESKFPYVVLSWRFREGTHWARRDGILTVDIFTKGPSIIEAELIRNRIIEILDRQFFNTDEGAKVRCYLDTDSLIPDEDPEVCHWTIDFSVIFWRKEFVENLIG